MKENGLFKLIKGYSFIITPIILVYSLYMMVSYNNIAYGTLGGIIFIGSICTFLLINGYKKLYDRIYNIFHMLYGIIGTFIIFIIFLWQRDINTIILSENLDITSITINMFFSIIIILGIGSLMLKILTYYKDEAEHEDEVEAD